MTSNEIAAAVVLAFFSGVQLTLIATGCSSWGDLFGLFSRPVAAFCALLAAVGRRLDGITEERRAQRRSVAAAVDLAVIEREAVTELVRLGLPDPGDSPFKWGARVL